MEKHKFASISLTVRDRAISSKFSTHRVPKQCTISNFQKNFLSSKMAAILNFLIFYQKWKNKFASISLTVQDRVISSKFSTHRVPKKCTIGNFQKCFLSPKMAAILNFQSADSMASLCGVDVRNFSDETTRPKDMLFFFKRKLIYLA